jgi:hypothetical protein
MPTLHIPGQHANLKEALAVAQAGDTIEIEGVAEQPFLDIDKPLTIRGGTIRGTEAVVMRLNADVVVQGCTIDNPNGHGIVCMSASPSLLDLRFKVRETAIACGGDSRPTIERVKAPSCRIGLSAQGTAAPQADDLVITSSGSGLFFTGQASGRLNQVAIASGQMAGVEISGEASPTLVGVAVVASGAGGFFVNGKARPTLKGCLAQRLRLAGLEVRDEADPQVDGFLVQESHGGGLFLHGTSTGTYLEVHVKGCALVGIEVSEDARPELERTTLEEGASGGIWVHDRAEVELIEGLIQGNQFMGVEVCDTGRIQLEQLVIRDNLDQGVVLRDKGQAGLVACELVDNHKYGLLGQDAARATVEGGRIEDNRQGALRAEGGAALVLDPAVQVRGPTHTADRGVVHQVEEA